MCSRNSKEASVAGQERAEGGRRGEVREVTGKSDIFPVGHCQDTGCHSDGIGRHFEQKSGKI